MIVDEIFVRDHKIVSAFPFPFLIMELCRVANVPIIIGVENEIKEMKKQDIEKTQDETNLI